MTLSTPACPVPIAKLCGTGVVRRLRKPYPNTFFPIHQTDRRLQASRAASFTWG